MFFVKIFLKFFIGLEIFEEISFKFVGSSGKINIKFIDKVCFDLRVIDKVCVDLRFIDKVSVDLRFIDKVCVDLWPIGKCLLWLRCRVLRQGWRGRRRPSPAWSTCGTRGSVSTLRKPRQRLWPKVRPSGFS